MEIRSSLLPVSPLDRGSSANQAERDAIAQGELLHVSPGGAALDIDQIEQAFVDALCETQLR